MRKFRTHLTPSSDPGAHWAVTYCGLHAASVPGATVHATTTVTTVGEGAALCRNCLRVQAWDESQDARRQEHRRFGARLRAWRTGKGLSQRALGEQVGASGCHLSDVERAWTGAGTALRARLEALMGA